MKNPTTLAELEIFLDYGHVWARMTNGAWWRVRRNGRTQRWKRDAERFRIPVKMGLRQHGEITSLGDFDYFYAVGEAMPVKANQEWKIARRAER